VLFAADISPVAAAETQVDDSQKQFTIGNQRTQLGGYRRRQGTRDHWPDSVQMRCRTERTGLDAGRPGLLAVHCTQPVGTSLHFIGGRCPAQRHCGRFHGASFHSGSSPLLCYASMPRANELRRQDKTRIASDDDEPASYRVSSYVLDTGHSKLHTFSSSPS